MRLDASYAIERILLERYSLFLKVYAHPMKFSAGAMLGKSMYYAMGTGATKLKQSDLEWMGDQELLLKLRDSRHSTTSLLANRLLQRQLYKPVYCGRVLKDEDLHIRNVKDMQDGFGKDKGFSSPESRDLLEKKIARKCGVADTDVIIFFPPSPPGLKKVETWVENGPGHVSKTDYVTHAEYAQLVKRHLALWKIYVFVANDVSLEGLQKVADEAELLIGRENELRQEPRFTLRLD